MRLRLPMSLRARLVAGMITIALVMITVVGIVISTTRTQLMTQIDQRLVAAADAGRFELFEHDDEEPHTDVPADLPRPERLSDLYEGRINSSGALLTINAPNLPGTAYEPPVLSLRPGDLAEDATTMLDVGDRDHNRYRVLVRRSGDRLLVYALPIHDLEETLRRLLVIQTLGALAILMVLGSVTGWVIHLGIRPIKEMTVTAAAIADGGLGARVPETSPRTEAGQLALTLNSMLEKIERASDEQRRSESRLRQFVADASHELRTPITTIRGYSELFRFGGLSDPEALDDAMRRTEQEAQRMGRLVEDMLTLAKFDQRRPMSQEAVNLSQMLRDIHLDASATAPERVLTVSFDGLDHDLIVTGDDDRLRQAISNVVANALLHTPAGGPVELSLTSSEGDLAIVTITDHGLGMSQEDADRATERFWRADTSRSRAAGGSGLGLSIVDSVISAHGGTTTVTSQEGIGTTVRLVIPIGDTTSQDANAPATTG